MTHKSPNNTGQNFRVAATWTAVMLCVAFTSAAQTKPIGAPATPPATAPGAAPPGALDNLKGGPPAMPPLPKDAPQPPSDPHNFEGVWVLGPAPSIESRLQLLSDVYGNPIPLNEQGKKVLDRRLTALAAGTPYINASSKCRPGGEPWILEGATPFAIFQTPARMEFISVLYHASWKYYFDPAKVPVGPKEYMGRSIAHWDGSTLVVDTSDFKQALWLDAHGTPMSATGRMIERIRKVQQGDWLLEIVTTVDDPVYYTRPWSFIHLYMWRPDMSPFTSEYNCELQIGDKSVNVDSGLIPEPQD